MAADFNPDRDTKMTTIQLGCIADDFTGASDLAGLLARAGMRVVQTFGIPTDAAVAVDADAIVVALKSRSLDPHAAVSQSLAAVDWLAAQGVSRFYFKYCSTFDSTPRGNIGPVAEALADRLQAPTVVFCPAFPENGRTVYRGHLFVEDRLLNESGMEHHPLNPMQDADLVRLLAVQVSRPVGRIRYDVLKQGAAAIYQQLTWGEPFLICDALDDEQLREIARALVDQPLVTGGSALAGHLADILRERQAFQPRQNDVWVTGRGGPAAVLAGSCSPATQRQIRCFATRFPVLHIDVANAARDDTVLTDTQNWIDRHLPGGPVLITTTADAETLRQTHAELGREHAAETAEAMLSAVGDYLVAHGVVRLIIAGGETSGSVVSRLGIKAIRIGPEITPGVPWTYTVNAAPLALALKSGNFGKDSFFLDALEMSE